jgi:hypothetical protein
MILEAKATSDTIWDWKIQEDKIFWNNGIQAVWLIMKIKLETVQNGG